MYHQSETSLLAACRTLFGHEVSLNQGFLDYLQPSGVKRAFRNLAKAHHPDGFAQSPSKVRSKQADRFREIRQAYDLIIDFLEYRHQRKSWLTHCKATQASRHRGRSTSHHRPTQKPHCRPAVIPAIPLEFGMFSYYQGKVTYQQLIEALIWQRRQRPTLGAIARDWGWLSEAKVSQILGHRGHAVRFGKKALELGYLRPQQVDALLRHQRSLQRKIGQYFIENGLITEEEADQIAQSLDHHNSQISRYAASRQGSGL